MLIIKDFLENSIAKNLGILKQDKILCFNNFKAVDILDYLFYDEQNSFVIKIERDNKIFDINVEKNDFESLGLVFESDNLDIKTCYNKCVFCFVDQMPKGLRKTLYVKDDDYRHSFLEGNFVTLTNANSEDIERIIRLNLSPMYVSVQATDAEVRKILLGNRFAGDILDKLKKLTEGGIKIHTQVVLIERLNDGEILNKTCRDLYNLGENLLSIAVVPCGITKYRENLYPIKDISVGYAKCMTEWVKIINSEFHKNLVTIADEFYFKANVELPNKQFYGDFSQIGNGVGGATNFSSEITKALKKKKHSGNYILVCGTSAKSFIEKQVERIKKYSPNVNILVVAVKNNFFGETVNCTGLLTGKDIVKEILSLNSKYENVVLPDVCLKQDEDIFLDDMTIQEFKNILNKKIIITDGSGQSFFDSVTGGSKVRVIK